MALFKKPNRKFRQRVTLNDSEEEDINFEANEKDKKAKSEAKEKHKPSTVEIKEKISTAINISSNVFSKENSSKDKDEKVDMQLGRPVTTKLLSFHDEEDDGEVFKVKKSNHSRRLAKLLEKERKKRQENPEPGSVVEENQEIKSEIKSDSQNSDQPLPSKEAWDILNGKDAEDMEVESDDETKDGQNENPFKDVLKSGVIPDAATIYAMKKHRQMAREMGDFIPVDDPERTEESKSRLVREDDNDRSDDDDDDDEPSRLSFTVNTGAVERQKVREAFLSVQEGCQAELENDEADELERWEREQIRKGVSIAQVGQQQHQQLEKQIFPYQSNITEKQVFTSRMPDKEDNSKYTVRPPMPPYTKEDKINLTTGIIKTRLQERLTSLNEVHRAHQQELETCHNDLESAYKLIKQLEEEGPSLADRFSLYQQMRGYVKDLVECLDFKVAHIELLEGKIMDLFKLKADRLIARRQQDIRDQADEYSLLSSKVLRGSSVDISNEKNNCTDEIKLRRIAEREGRRMRRRKFRENQQSSIKHHEGMSSDDEEPEIDIIKFRNKKESILDEADIIFEDVVDEFGTIQGLKTSFEKWRKEQKDSYCDAFVPLCLPKIFGPFIRVELMDWNPLENNKDLERMPWYDCLVFYGSNEDDVMDAEEKEDPDTNLLPGIIEKIILSKITAFAQNVWDPLSTRETLNLVSLVKKLFEDYPTVNGKSKQTQALLQAVCTRIYKSLDDDVFIPLYPKELLENRSLGSSTFFQRQFWTSVKLLRNILSWHGVIAEQPLQDMALASLLNRYLLMGLLTSLTMKDTFDKCRMIVSTFPRAWFLNLKGSSTLLQLKKFSQFLLQFAQQLHSQNTKRGQEESDAKDTVKEIGQMLVTMGALEEAVTLGKQFSISFFKNSAPNKC